MNSLKCIECSRNTLEEDCIFLQCQHILCYPCGHHLVQEQLYDEEFQYECRCGQISPFETDVIRILRKIPTPKKDQSRQLQINQIKCLYCFDCNTDCFSIQDYLSGMHKNHDVKYIRKAYQQLQISASQMISRIKQNQTKLQVTSKKLQTKSRQISQTNEIQKSKIKTVFDQLRNALSSKQRYLYEQIDRYYEKQCEIAIDKSIENVDKNLQVLDKYLHEINQYIYSQETSYSNAFHYYNNNKNKIQDYLKQLELNHIGEINITKNSYFNVQDIPSSKILKIIESIKFQEQGKQIQGKETCRPNKKNDQENIEDASYMQYFKKAKQQILNRNTQFDAVIKNKQITPLLQCSKIDIPHNIKANLAKYSIKPKVASKLSNNQDTQNEIRNLTKQRISRIQSMFYGSIQKGETKRRHTTFE